MSDLEDRLVSKIKVLSETVWEQKVSNQLLDDWLKNFHGKKERLHALWLLSQFMYFGSREIRELLGALYRDLVKYPIVASIRKANGNTRDIDLLKRLYADELQHTRFLGMGNPSESGCHLLYYFRQENGLPKNLFIYTHEIFSRVGTNRTISLRHPEVTRYIYLDDFCGSGNQASGYSDGVLEDIKELKSDVELAYFTLFATEQGITKFQQKTGFDKVDAVFRLDDTYKCFEDESRYFVNCDPQIKRLFAEKMCSAYGDKLSPSNPLGYEDGQLLLGFHHNTPDNTLPIIWFDEEAGIPWTPIFRRYPKFYGWIGA